MDECQFLGTPPAELAQDARLKRSYLDLINSHRLFIIPPPIIFDIRSETAPPGPREANSYSGRRHARRDLHRHDPDGNEDDQP